MTSCLRCATSRPRTCDDLGSCHPDRGPARRSILSLGCPPDRGRVTAGGGVRGRRGHRHPGRAGGLRAAAAGRDRPPGGRTTSGTRRSTSTGWSARCRSGWAGTGTRCTSTSTSSTAPGARTSRSPASPGWRPRPASRCSCCTRCSLRRARRQGGQHQGAGLLRQGRGPAVPRLRRTPGSTTSDAAGVRGWGCRRSRSASVARLRAAAPGRRRRHARTSAAAPAGSAAILWTIAEFCARRAAAVLLRRRRGRAAQYTMLHRAGGRPAEARRLLPVGDSGAMSDRRAGCVRYWRGLVDSRDDQVTDDVPPGSGAGRRPALGTVNAFLRRLHSSVGRSGR